MSTTPCEVVTYFDRPHVIWRRIGTHDILTGP